MKKPLLWDNITTTRRIATIVVLTILILGFAWSAVWALSSQLDTKPNKFTDFQFSNGSPISVFIPIIKVEGGLPEEPPFIINFSAGATTIAKGSSTVIEWEIQNSVATVDLVPSGSLLTDGSGATVSPTTTTTYELTVTNEFGSDTAELTITVVDPQDPPTINSFTASPDRVPEGTATTLSWNIDGPPTSVSISPNVGDVTGLSSIDVFPTEDTTYTITAVNNKGSDQAQVSVVHVSAPQIDSFTASQSSIDEGENTDLNWTTSGDFDSITLNPGNIDVTNLSTYNVSPLSTTTYSLVITGEGGSNTKTKQITVINPPVINSFSVDVPTDLYVGDDMTFSWSIANPTTSITISPEVGDVTGQTSAIAPATVDGTYTITAVNSAGSDSAEVTVNVIEPPVIDSFTAESEYVISGESTTLNWAVSGENVTLSLSNGIGDVTGLTEYEVSPTEQEVYVLTATNNSGSVTADVTVSVSSGAAELVVFDWDRDVTQGHHGFPNNTPPRENYDYTGTPNYAQGTLYFRAEVNDQPVPQEWMRIQLCYWQELDGNNFGLETCGPLEVVSGTPGNIVCWSTPISSMWKLNGQPLDWSRPRYRIGLAIKNRMKLPVSDYEGWNWNGEDPEDWYPLDLHFTAILVAQGEPFSGFDDCTIE